MILIIIYLILLITNTILPIIFIIKDYIDKGYLYDIEYIFLIPLYFILAFLWYKTIKIVSELYKEYRNVKRKQEKEIKKEINISKYFDNVKYDLYNDGDDK